MSPTWCARTAPRSSSSARQPTPTPSSWPSTGGAAGYLSKSLTAQELVDAIEAIAAGRRLVAEPQARSSDTAAQDWPGHGFDLSPREAEMMAFIAKGLSNQEIADTVYLSVNSVKTHIRTAYRKIGLTRRSQATRWALEHGFGVDTKRSFPEA